MIVDLGKWRPVCLAQRLWLIEALEDNRLLRERLGEELAGETGDLAHVIALDRRARAHANQPIVATPHVFFEAANQTRNLDTARATVGMHLVQYEIAHLLVAKDALILAAHQ